MGYQGRGGRADPAAQPQYALLVDLHHQVRVVQQAGVSGEVLVGDHVLVELLWAQRQKARGEAEVPCDPLSPPLPAAPSLPLGPPAAQPEQGSWLPGALASAGPTPCCPGVTVQRHSALASGGLGDAQHLLAEGGLHEASHTPPLPTLEGLSSLFRCPGLSEVLGRAGPLPSIPVETSLPSARPPQRDSTTGPAVSAAGSGSCSGLQSPSGFALSGALHFLVPSPPLLGTKGPTGA